MLNLSKYSSNGSFDEFITKNKKFRSKRSMIFNYLNSLSNLELKDLILAKDHAIRSMGLTFRVYDDKNILQDRLWPLDFIPRILSKSEWEKISNGLIQRSKALNMFIEDCYNEQEFLKSEIMDPKLVTDSPSFLKECIGMKLKYSVWAHVCGTDLVRDKDGKFYVLEDNLRVPSGASYMIENRMVMKRVFPDLFNDYDVLPVDEYTTKLYSTFKSLSDSKNPEIVLLTPGIFNSAYFEHSYLAQQLGIDLVEGSDLRIGKGGFVYKKTIFGLVKVDIIYRRINDDFLDPLVWNKKSTLGVPGLIKAWKDNKVVIVNAPGSGIADDKAIYSYVPDMIKFFLNEKPILNNIKTYLCSNKKDRNYVEKHIRKLVVKPVNESGGYGIVIGKKASESLINDTLRKIKKNPRNFVAQPFITLSTGPTYVSGDIDSRNMDLRPFILSGKNNYVSPGGLTRVALKKGSYIVNSSQGGGSKDTWIVG